ncbi:MAG: peptidoglycan D,D-transpeptidase FtsI family protein [Angustibacter sp.]
MNTPIRKIAAITLMLFGSLLLSSTYLQFVQAGTLNEKPGNRRTLLENYSRKRGPIVLAGKQIVQSQPTDDQLKYLRKYPEGPLYSHVTGYYSFVYGSGAGIERSSNSFLSGSGDQFFYRRVSDLLTGREREGASVELTINPAAQRAANSALGGQKGAVVALDPKTGAILALVSNPTYDPNLLSSHDLAKVAANYKTLLNDPDDPLVNRAISGDLYPPGSTFKIVTAAAALSSGKYQPDTQVYGGKLLDLPQTTVNLPNSSNSACGANDRVTLVRALEVSCNTAFGTIGLDLGAESLRSQSEKFGFGDDISVPMPVTSSRVPKGMNPPQTAQAAIGQYDVRVTPLQVAMIAAGVANDGVVMRPYSIKNVRTSDLDILEKTQPQELTRAVSPEVAAQLQQMMQSVVDNGTGSAAKISGVTVGGKTGTAQQGGNRNPHVWFTAFAPVDDPQIAVAVVVNDGGDAGGDASGGRIAAPIARSVIQAVIK